MKNISILCLLLCLAAFARAADAEKNSSLPVFSHPRDITNRHLPLAALKRDVLENKSKRTERTARPEIQKTFQIGGRTVEAFAVEDRDFDDGQLEEVTLDYFA